MDFTPIAPLELNGTIDGTLYEKANNIIISSAKLAGSHNFQILNSIKDLLKIVNSYYSNKIESEGTHPIDIEKAMKRDFSKDEKKKKLQYLSLAYIDTQKQLEEILTTNNKFDVYSLDTILMCHKLMYDRDEMKDFLKIHHKDHTVEMIPGELRNMDVEVGKHIAPEYDKVESILKKFSHLYSQSIQLSISDRLIYALASHHRLMWIHPFLDGNGRASRLMLDIIMHKIGVVGYGLWNISRGLAREEATYKELLEYADMTRQGEYDGRGALSTRGLKAFVEFMLDVAKDQIDYMDSCLNLGNLSTRIENYVRDSQSGYLGIEPLPKGSEIVFKELLLHGEIKRGRIDELLSVSRRSATNIAKNLLERGYFTSSAHNAPLFLNFNTHISQFLFPELIPKLP